MDELRKKRYRDKIQHIFDYIQDLPVEPKNELEKRGIFYSLQTSIEALVDLTAMLVKDLGVQVKEDNFNISEIVKIKKLNPELGEKLKKANGLRNIIVHRYNAIDEQIILDSVQEVKDLLLIWIEVIEGSINEIR
ncbi:MAG: type VII toxin-antitoxin system HepT family RNase toxin [Promethearchaeota archaeon]